ncbi:hypothetical protein ACFL4G_12095 [Thermodesulfobacteriota bacterium]
MRKSIMIAFIATFSAFSIPAFGDTIQVPADQPTIREGIDAAVDGDIGFIGLVMGPTHP